MRCLQVPEEGRFMSCGLIFDPQVDSPFQLCWHPLPPPGPGLEAG